MSSHISRSRSGIRRVRDGSRELTHRSINARRSSVSHTCSLPGVDTAIAASRHSRMHLYGVPCLSIAPFSSALPLQQVRPGGGLFVAVEQKVILFTHDHALLLTGIRSCVCARRGSQSYAGHWACFCRFPSGSHYGPADDTGLHRGIY